MKHLLLFILLNTILIPAIFGQEIDTRFGKNRVQYSDDFDSWSSYETENFITYWYGKSRNVAISSLQLAEYDFKEIQNILEQRISEKIEIIVYGDIAELYQTNIGLQGDNPQNVETIQLIGTKLFVHFDGNHQNLRENIREGIAKAYIFSMLYGSSFTEIVQNSFMADMPEWFKNGIIQYAKNKWTDEDDAKMRFLTQEKKKPYKKFEKLNKRETEIAGKAFWYYIGETYGISSISNIIYLTRINRSVKSAFRYVLGEEYTKVSQDCMTYYQERYKQEESVFPIPDRKSAFLKNSNKSTFQHLKISPDGSKLAYSTNKNGRISFYVKDLKTNKKKKIKSIGYNNPYRETDNNYPLFFWSEDSNLLGYIYEYKNVIELRIFNFEKNSTYKSTLNPIFNRVYSVDFLDAENLVFSGNINGFSDLIAYNLNTRIQKNITEDYFDDLDASVAKINNIKGIVFSSNRNRNDIIPTEMDTFLLLDKYDLYFLPLEDRSKLYRLTNSEFANEMNPEIHDNTISYISDKYGVKSIIQQEFSNAFKLNANLSSIQLTTNIISKSCLTGDCFYSVSYNNRELIYREIPKQEIPKFTFYKQKLLNSESIGPVLIEEIEVPQVEDLENIPEGWFFNTIYGNTENLEVKKSGADKKKNSLKVAHIHQFQPLRITPSRLRFKIQDMSTNINNDVLFTGLNSYANNQVGYQQQPMGLLMKMKVGDAFEDYLLEGGVRVAIDFSGYETYFTFEDRKRKWDHFYGIYYRSRTNRRIDQFEFTPRNKSNTFLGYYQIKYPFDEFQSVRLSGTIRNDKDFKLITDNNSYNQPVFNTQRIGVRAEYVYDNSSQRSLNIYNGIRSKFFVEGMNRFRIQVADPFIIEPSNGFMGLLGLDTRYYYPVLQKSVLAARISAGTSLGTDQVLFYLGGVERAILGGFDQSTGIPDREFAFENIAPQLRGFDRNIRNGTSYVVTTVELRVPIFRHLISDQIRYDFLREFQVVGFVDSGTAWHGLSPYSPENPINSATFESGQSVVFNVQYFRDPLVLGYGIGFRTSIMGYFLKMDFARGIETKSTLPLKVHLSLGTDF